MQVWPRNKERKCYSLKLDKSLNRILSIENYCWSSTQTVSIENYEIRFSRSDYMYTPMYLCRVSFLTTLDIYKDYFYGPSQSDVKCCKNNTCILWPKAKIDLIHHSLSKSYYIFMQRVLWPRSFPIFIVDELKNFAANIFLKLVC